MAVSEFQQTQDVFGEQQLPQGSARCEQYVLPTSCLPFLFVVQYILR